MRGNRIGLQRQIFVFVIAVLLLTGLFSGQTLAADPQINMSATAETANQLLTLMKENGNMKITLTKDISGTTRAVNWCELGTGIKVLELDGHRLSISNNDQRYHGSPDNNLFYVGKGSELVINDSTDKGYVHYDGKLALDGTLGTYKDGRNIIKVDGGKFTLNGGTVEAGRCDKFYSSWDAAHYWRQINGSAIVLEKGEVNIQGGTILGRGYIYKSDGTRSRCAAVYATGGDLKVYDGVFWGKGDADVFNISDKVHVRVYGGTFDLHRFDKKIAYESDYVAGAGTEAYGFTSSYGKIGIPARATSNGFPVTDYYKSGRLMNEQECKDGVADKTSSSIVARPKKIQEHLEYETHQDYKINTCEDESAELQFEWDKDKRLAFGINVPCYFPETRSFDRIKKHEYPGFTATIATSPDATKGVNATLTDFPAEMSNLDGDSWSKCMVDLARIPQEALADLKSGHTYYVLVKGTEIWQNQRSYKRIVTPYQTVKIHIIDPNEDWKNYDIELKYDNKYDDASKNCDLAIRPVGFGCKMQLDSMKYKGYIDNYQVQLSYVGTDGNRKTGTFTPENLPEREWVVNDAKCGANLITYDLVLYKNGNVIGEKHAEATAVHFPYFTTDPVPGADGTIMFAESASSKNVYISSNTDNQEGLFWTRDDNKITSAGNDATILVSPATPNDTSWYSLGYNVNGQDYFSKQNIIIGVKDGDRSASISASNTSCLIVDDADSTPNVTVKAEGTEWGSNLIYFWYSVFIPKDGTAESVFRQTVSGVSETNMTKSLAQIRNRNASQLREGDYVVSCKITNASNKSVRTPSVTIHVNRGAAGIEVYSHDILLNHKYDPYNVTDRFIVNYSQDAVSSISLKATPENALFPNDITAESSNSEIAEVVNLGDGSYMISGQKPGYATVTWKTNGGKGNITGKTTVMTPRNHYSITVPKGSLEAKVGAAVKDGELTVPVGEDFTADLLWYTKDGKVYEKEVFEGNREYYPVIRIYPKKGVGYPGQIEDDATSMLYYVIDKDSYVITVNGIDYYGASDCGRDQIPFEKNHSIASEEDYKWIPSSEGEKSDDYIDLELASTGKLIDPKDDYLNRITFTLDQPMAGSPKDQTEDTITNLSYSILTDGVLCGGDSVVHITDPATIEDDIIANDKSEEEFTTYEEGQTYRASVWLVGDSKYRNADGGRLYFADEMEVVEPDCRTILDTSVFKTGEMRQVYVYFTIRPKDQDTPVTDPATQDPDTAQPKDPDAPGGQDAASVSSVEEKIIATKSEKDLEGSDFFLLQAKGSAKSKKSIKLTWKKVPGATQYIIYGAKCGKKNHFKKLTTVTKTAYTQKKLKKGTYYKYIVLAVKGEQTLTMSKTIHVVTNGGKRGNNTKVTLNKKKLSLQVGKTKKLKAALKAKRKVSLHRAIAWESSDPAIAEVTGKGNAIKVKAKSKGTCTIYAYAQNGICASCRITVK